MPKRGKDRTSLFRRPCYPSTVHTRVSCVSLLSLLNHKSSPITTCPDGAMKRVRGFVTNICLSFLLGRPLSAGIRAARNECTGAVRQPKEQPRLCVPTRNVSITSPPVPASAQLAQHTPTRTSINSAPGPSETRGQRGSNVCPALHWHHPAPRHRSSRRRPECRANDHVKAWAI